MSLLDGNDLFGSGPHTITPGPWERALQRRGFAGVDGELVLNMGIRSRSLTQQGRLQAQTAAALRTLTTAIEAYLDSQLHTLTDNHSGVYSRVIIESFSPESPINRGRGFWCEYTVLYRQIP